MNRGLLLAVAVLIVAGLAIRLGQDEGGAAGGCDGVRRALDLVTTVESSGEVPTAETYASAGQDLRRAAVAAPAGVSPDVHALADAYGQLGILYQGFDPADPATYAVIEQRAPDIERQEARVDDAAAEVDTWLRETCRA